MIRGLRILVLAAACLQPGTALASDAVEAPAAETAEVKRLPGGAVLRIAPGTRLSFGKSTRLLLAPQGTQKTLTHPVALLSGRVEIELPSSKVPTVAVLVRGPNKISAVAKGGHSVVIAAPKRLTIAAMTDDMLVANGNDWKTLRSGVVREFIGGAAAVDHAVIAAPQLGLSSPIRLRLGDSSTAATARATQVANAASYDFGVWKQENGSRVLVQRLKADNPSVALPDLDPGTYTVTVRAVEASGLESRDSEAVPLRVVGAQLPDGAKLVEGGIALRPQQRITLLGTEGVEVSYGRTPMFFAAPRNIGLIRREPTLVRLRAAGTTGELALSLEPRSIHAQIDIGPRRARWPHDAVNVAVRLTDARGRPIPQEDRVSTRVHVNVTPVALAWKRNGNVLTTVVPRPAEAGPWVVRVEVTDETGTVVGRDFLEVASEAPRAQR